MIRYLVYKDNPFFSVQNYQYCTFRLDREVTRTPFTWQYSVVPYQLIDIEKANFIFIAITVASYPLNCQCLLGLLIYYVIVMSNRRDYRMFNKKYVLCLNNLLKY